MTVTVATITRDEAAHIERWAGSCADADHRVILDTGSTDDTVQVARDCGITVYEATINPWRFDVARNRLLDLLPDCDWVVTLDADEILVPGWYGILAELSDHPNRVRYNYVWSWKDDGVPDVQFRADRIHRRHTHHWVWPCHEHITTKPGYRDMWAETDLTIEHHPDPGKSRGQYLDLLRLGAAEDPDSDRMAFYLGRELYFHGMYAEAREELWRYLHMPSATWPAERAHAWTLLAAMDDDPERWWHRALAEDPTRRETWVGYAEWLATIGDARADSAKAHAATLAPAFDYLGGAHVSTGE